MGRKIVDETLKFDIIINGDKAKKEYGQLERANRKLLQANEDLEAQAKKLEKANKSNSEEYKKLKSDIEANSKTVDANKVKMSSLTKEIGINNLSMRQLSTEARKLNGILSNLDPESEKWADYNKQLQTVKGRMANLREEMKTVDTSMDQQLEVLGKLGAGFGQVFTSLRSGDYRGAAQGFDTIKEGIKGATAAALKFIATPIGAAIALLAGIGFAAKEWFDYNREAREAITLTEQITGLVGEQATATRLQAKNLEESYGVEFQETLETAKNLVREFKITYTQALDEIEEGLIRGQKNNNEFFESLREYDVFFSNAGFAVSEFRKVIETGYDLGVYSDKLPDAIKEFDLSMREQTKSTKEALSNAFGAAFTDDLLTRVKRGETTTKEALQEISAEASKTGLNIQQNAQLTADVFRGAGEDVGGAVKILEAFNIALNQGEEALTPLQEMIRDVAAANRELAEAQDEALKSDNYVALANDVELFWIKTKTLFFQGIKSITDWFSRSQESLTSFFFQFVTVVQSMPEIAKTAFVKLKDEVVDVVKTFGGLGEVMENLMSFNFSAAKESFSRFKEDFKREAGDVHGVVVDTVNMVNNIRKSVDESVRLEFEKKRLAAAEQTSLNTGTNTTGTTFTPDYGNELQPEDKKKVDSKKRLYELLDQMEEERALQEQLKLIEKDQRAEEEEIHRIENKFKKLEEQAEGEAELLKRLEEEKLLQIQDVRDKYGEIRAEKDKKSKAEEAARQKKLAEELIEADRQLNEAKQQSLNAGLGMLQSFFGKSSALGKALFVLQKGLAISEIVKGASQAISAAISNEAKIPFFIPTPLGVPLPNPGKALSTAATVKQVAGVKTMAATQIASILGQAVQGFEDGLYPMRRKDGKTFNTRFGGSPSTQIVPAPTHFIAGEVKPEMIIDGDTFRRMDPAITDYILTLAGKRLPGFQDGMYPKGQQNEELMKALNQNTATMAMLNERLQEPLTAEVLYGPEASRKQQEYDEKIRNVRNNAKIRQHAV